MYPWSLYTNLIGSITDIPDIWPATKLQDSDSNMDICDPYLVVDMLAKAASMYD